LIPVLSALLIEGATLLGEAFDVLFFAQPEFEIK
jgi:hypothetical protein